MYHPAGGHAIPVPMYKEIAPGTLNNILLKSLDPERNIKR